ncbi:MAG: hypothetical protein J6U92_05120 [Clostridia bacterium]|nr:hypothetical protein [Clostridia bacterium]
MIENSQRENLQSQPEEVDADSVKCLGCGSNMVFNPEKQTLTCPHCGSKQDFSTDVFASELSLVDGFGAGNGWGDDKPSVFECDNCSARVVLNYGETAKVCPFCGTAHVKKTESLAGLKPNAVVPFLITAEKALDLSKEWAKRRLFAPRKFKKNICAENVNGVYSPCFTFDSSTTSYYEGKIGRTHTRTVGSGKNKRTEVYTVWQHIRGTYNDCFNDVLINAGSKLGQDKLDQISPFDTENSRKYQKEYLYGFMAYHYDTSIEDCWGSAKGVMDGRIRRGILSRYVYDKVAYLNVSTSHQDVTYKYVMLPVYVGNFNYKKKLYNFYVNGSTGKVKGKTPKSLWKILLTVALCLGVALSIVYLFLTA